MKIIDRTMMSAIAEILSAVAIVMTVICLAVENRHSAVQTEQSTAALQSSSRQEILYAEVGLVYELMERSLMEVMKIGN